jgi:hypothetical protein
MAELIVRALPPITAQDRERFWAKIKIGTEAECWLWTGFTNEHGYGQFGYGPFKQQRIYKAHRVAYLLGYGIDPGEKFVCHACDQPLCCNPAHLWLGDAASNNQDSARKGRKPVGENHPNRVHPENMARGERHGHAKLTEADVIEMRRLRATGEWTTKALAAKFGVCRPVVSVIINRKAWLHVP